MNLGTFCPLEKKLTDSNTFSLPSHRVLTPIIGLVIKKSQNWVNLIIYMTLIILFLPFSGNAAGSKMCDNQIDPENSENSENYQMNNNSASDPIRSPALSPGSTGTVLDIYNLLNDKENVNNRLSNNSNNMEKNVRRSMTNLDYPVLRPALRSTASTNNNHQFMDAEDQLSLATMQQTPKVFKHIRFNLSNSNSNNNSENMTPTPPPKEFKRMGDQRKTLRTARCMSTIVTEKERALLVKSPLMELSEEADQDQEAEEPVEQSPKPAQGFVKSMCKFYADTIKITSKSSLNRSNSFSGKSDTETALSSDQKRGSFRLFRSNSWSTRRKKSSETSNSSSPGSDQVPPAQRCSPSYSTKSQDSGFSEQNAEQQQQQQHSQQLRAITSTSQLIQNQRLQFLRSNMESREDEEDPNLTQIPPAASAGPTTSGKPVNHQLASQQPVHQGKASQRVSEALGNIASLQTGLRLKRSMAEEDHERPLEAPTSIGALNLLRPGQRTSTSKIRPKSFQESVNDLSQLSQDGGPFGFNLDQPVFSTPVRASFRQRPSRLLPQPPRPHTAIHLEDARTPSKREGKTRLRELKTKGRRWSAVPDINMASLDPKLAAASPEAVVDPTLVAAWSQFVNYEPTLQTLSSMVTPPFRYL
jgi:hypothetical protein